MVLTLTAYMIRPRRIDDEQVCWKGFWHWVSALDALHYCQGSAKFVLVQKTIRISVYSVPDFLQDICIFTLLYRNDVLFSSQRIGERKTSATLDLSSLLQFQETRMRKAKGQGIKKNRTNERQS